MCLFFKMKKVFKILSKNPFDIFMILSKTDAGIPPYPMNDYKTVQLIIYFKYPLHITLPLPLSLIYSFSHTLLHSAHT